LPALLLLLLPSLSLLLLFLRYRLAHYLLVSLRLRCSNTRSHQLPLLSARDSCGWEWLFSQQLYLLWLVGVQLVRDHSVLRSVAAALETHSRCCNSRVTTTQLSIDPYTI
jgi:hypothetical protein